MRALLQARPTAWRAPLIAACLLAAAAHVPVTAEHLDEALYIGLLFIALEIASVTLALLLIWRSTRAALLAVSVVGALAVIAFLWSRSIGLPLIEDDIGSWTEPLAVISVAAESVMAVGGYLAAQRPVLPVRRAATIAGAAGAAALLGAGLPLTLLAAHATAPSDGMDMSMSMGGMSMAGMGGSTAGLSGHWAAVGGAAATHGRTRTVDIAAEPVRWKAVTGSRDTTTGGRVAADVAAASSGTVCAYRRYIDATFQTATLRTVQQQYLGVLGPVLHVEVGDTLRVVFTNHCAFPVSIHPTGLRTGKNDEGASYADVTMGTQKQDDAVAPGGTFTYTWTVPARSGPAAADGSSVAWQYGTGVGGGAKVAALTGVIVVTRQGEARPDGTPKDVDHEFVVDAVAADAGAVGVLHDSINGYRAGSLPMVAANQGQRVRWYVLDSGTAATTVRWYGNTLESGGNRVSSVAAAPGTVTVADMVPDDFGWWLLDTGRPGGAARYTITP